MPRADGQRVFVPVKRVDDARKRSAMRAPPAEERGAEMIIPPESRESVAGARRVRPRLPIVKRESVDDAIAAASARPPRGVSNRGGGGKRRRVQ